MARQKLGGFNASSMADIAFLLLIFFLVTTTMDTDSGISRKLPPMPEKNQQKSSDRIKERNVFVVLINKNNQLLVEGEPMDVSQLKDKAKEYGHSTSVDAAIAANALKAKLLLLYHISPRYKERNRLLYEARRFFNNTYIAEQYMKVVVLKRSTRP